MCKQSQVDLGLQTLWIVDFYSVEIKMAHDHSRWPSRVSSQPLELGIFLFAEGI